MSLLHSTKLKIVFSLIVRIHILYEIQFGQLEIEVSLKFRAMKQNFCVYVSGNGLLLLFRNVHFQSR